MEILRINNVIIKKPLLDIIYDIQRCIHNGKLKTIRDRGDNVRITCPFHKDGLENKASADIYIGDEIDKLPYGWFKCFTCGEQGPFQKFVAACLECSIADAEKWLVDNYGEEFGDDTLLDLPEIILNPNKPSYLPETALAQFESFHPYMTQRKLSKRIIDVFEVKYDSQTQSLVFPVRDENGKLVMLTRRNVTNKNFIIDKNKEKPLYLLYYIKQHNIEHAMLTEGQIDALTACTYGFPCMATMGAISDHQIDLLNKSGIRVLYLMFDNDAAGYRFTQKVLSRLNKSILPVIVKIPFCNKKDINDLTEEEFEYCIKQAETSY